MWATVFVPITLPGSLISTRGSRAALQNSIRSYLKRIVDKHRHSRLNTEFDKYRFPPEICSRHLRQRPIQWRNHRAYDHSVDLARLQFRQRKKIASQDSVFVDGLIASRRQSPVRHKLLASEHSKNGIRIANVQC